jgi:PAS domain S-box-containing protein
VVEEAALWVQELRHGGFEVHHSHVASLTLLRSELEGRPWDIVLTGYGDGEVTTPQVANLLRELGLDIPVISVGDQAPPLESPVTTHPLVRDTAMTVRRGGLAEAIRNAFAHVPGLGLTSHTRSHKDDQRFRKMADQAPVMLWMTDAGGRCVFLNQRWNEFRGRPLTQELENGWQDGLHPGDRERCLTVFARTLKDRESFSIEYRMLRWDGDYRWLLDTGVPQFDRDGAFVGFIGSCVDITDRRRWEEGLRQRDRLLDAVAHATNLLLTSDDLGVIMPNTLRHLGEAMGVDRAYIFENHTHPQSGAPLMSQRYEWCRLEVTSQIDNTDMQAMPYDPGFTRLLKLLQAGKSYSGLVRDFPDSERLFLEAQNIRSVLCVPIQTRDRLWGFIGFDDCHSDRIWAANDEALLIAMAGSVGAAITRHQTENLLRARDRLLRGVALATHELLTAPSFDHAIRRALETLGQAADVERAYLFENFVDPVARDHRLRARFVWEKRPSTPPPDLNGLDNLSYDVLFPRWYEILSSGQPISGRMLDFFQAAAERATPLRSILLVPVISEGTFWGIVGLDDSNLTRAWASGDESILNAVAGSIGGAIARKRAEDALRSSEAHFRSLIENASDIIAILDANGLIQYLSPATERALGHEPERVLQRRVTDFLHPDDALSLAQVREVMRTQPEAIRTAEFRLRHRDGSWRVFEGVAKFLDTGGHDRRYVVNARDITERKRTEDALHHSEDLLRHSQKMEAVGRLAGGVAHDFNNLLTAIMGYGELILSRLRSSDPLHHEVEEICKAADRAHSLTRQLLAFSRKQVLEPKVVNLNTVVADLEKLLHRLIGEDIELRTELDHDSGLVRVDPGQMEQVLINLAVNARDAMPHGGQLTIRTAAADLRHRLSRGHVFVEPGQYVTVAVADTGKGMDENVQAHLFEPFFTTKEVGKGTGLGLSMVYGIVEQSGGHIMFDTAPGQGTTFTIYLPRIEGEQPDKARGSTTATSRGTETLLLVEDEEIVRDLAQRVLQEQGYTVLTARNGPEALRLMEERGRPVDLLLTDIVMPHFSGQSLAQRLRQKFEALRVLYMSGYAEDTFQGITDLSPESNFLQKPFTPASLARKVRDVLDAR